MERSNQWCSKQDYKVSEYNIKCIFNSNKSLVRDNYRIKLLKELGYNLEDIKITKDVPKTTGTYAGF